jgi:hypothetical protein
MEDHDLLREQLKTPRILLFIVAASALASALVFLPDPNWSSNPAGLSFTLLLAAIYFVLAFWAKKKPYTAILIGLALFVIIPVVMVIIDQAAYVHWPSKLIGFCLLLLGVSDAKDAQKKLSGL